MENTRRNRDGFAPTTQEERNLAVICHALSFAGSLIGPLILWQMKKAESAFVDAHGKECVNFQISMLIWVVCCTPLVFIIIGIPMLSALVVAGIVFTIIAMLRASEGEYYRYPLTIRFIK